jgi:hypothetical protein
MTEPLLPPPADTTGPAPLVPPPAAQAPSLRLGGLAPLFAPADIADPGRLRMGGLSPLFAPG